MTNADKYKISEEQADKISDEFAEWHQDNPDVKGYGEALFRFLQAEAKPILSEDEKVILKNVSIDFRYIRREKNGELYFCVAENKGCVSNIFANGLFDCIQPRRRI